MQDLGLREMFQKARQVQPQSSEEPVKSEPGWRRYMAKEAEAQLRPGEYRREKKKSPAKKALRSAVIAALIAVVGLLLIRVSKIVAPLSKELPATAEQIREAISSIGLSGSGEAKPKKPEVVTTAKKSRRGRGNVAAEEEPAAPPLPPYRGTVLAELTTTPLNPVQPFKVDVVDSANRHHKLDVRQSTQSPATVQVDITEPSPAVISEGPKTEPAPAPAAFKSEFKLTGPEADEVAHALSAQASLSRHAESHDTVGLVAVINRQGQISSIRRVNGSSALSQAAIDAVRRVPYQPFLDGNRKPVEMQAFVTVHFTIPGE